MDILHKSPEQLDIDDGMFDHASRVDSGVGRSSFGSLVAGNSATPPSHSDEEDTFRLAGSPAPAWSLSTLQPNVSSPHFQASNETPQDAPKPVKGKRGRPRLDRNAVRPTKRAKDSDCLNEAEDEEEKMQDRRSRNRVAASRCRQKKKISQFGLEIRHRQCEEANESMRMEERVLREQRTFWRMLALQHSHGQCNCDEIHQYNMEQCLKISSLVNVLSCPRTVAGSR